MLVEYFPPMTPVKISTYTPSSLSPEMTMELITTELLNLKGSFPPFSSGKLRDAENEQFLAKSITFPD